MEVHHHTKTGKKKFKEYFFEFVMLFLAVTLGFFAEHLREQIKITQATGKSMEAMISDLRMDSAMYRSILAGNEYSSRMDDTLIDMLSEKNPNTGHIYFLARNVTAIFDFVRPNSRTFEQLKSGGTLQLINNEAILDSITSYYQSSKWFDEQNLILLDKMNEVHQSNRILFSGTTFAKMFSHSYTNK